MKKLLLASNNPGKLKEFQALLDTLEAQIITPSELGLQLDVKEDGRTYAENAARKALGFSQASGLVSLADDTGLEVDELDGHPGLHSARFVATPGATDADRRRHLLQVLLAKPKPWKAQFRCVVAVAVPSGGLLYGEGVCEGEIIPEERGAFGFGYDPIFWIPSVSQTMAELSLPEKNRLSHRARAVQAVRPQLEALLQNPL